MLSAQCGVPSLLFWFPLFVSLFRVSPLPTPRPWSNGAIGHLLRLSCSGYCCGEGGVCKQMPLACVSACSGGLHLVCHSPRPRVFLGPHCSGSRCSSSRALSQMISCLCQVQATQATGCLMSSLSQVGHASYPPP